MIHKTKKNNPQKLATQDTQDEEKQFRETGNIEYTRRRKIKQKTQHTMCWTPLCANENKYGKKRHDPSYKQQEVKTNQTQLRFDNNLDFIIHFYYCVIWKG